jgi:hypothetical protein
MMTSAVAAMVFIAALIVVTAFPTLLRLFRCRTSSVRNFHNLRVVSQFEFFGPWSNGPDWGIIGRMGALAPGPDTYG